MKKIINITLSLFLSITLSACSGIGKIIANAPAVAYGGEIKEDIAYGTDKLQKLDVYIPNNAIEKNKLPVIVFFYGGGWDSGSKDDYKFFATQLSNKGFVVVVPDYRKYPNVIYPEFVKDGASAVNWVHKNIDKYNGLNDKIFITGHSAGAHIGAMLVSNKSFLRDTGDAYKSIKGFVGLAGPYSFTPKEDKYKKVFGSPKNYDFMKVDNYIDGTEPPMLLLHGDEDEVVAKFNLERLEKAIKQKNDLVEKKIYKGVSHVGIIASTTWFWPSDANIIDDIANFFKKQK